MYHFTFTGEEQLRATVRIAKKKLVVAEGHEGRASLEIVADGATWLGVVRRERRLLPALLRRRIRLRGPTRLLVRFGRCFPS